MAMNLLLFIQSGTSQGKKFLIHDGMRIGRSAGEVILNDSKISSIHAQIEQSPTGEFTLVDRKSSNGIVIEDQKVKSLRLMPGVAFKIGRILIRVIEEDLEAATPDELSQITRPLAVESPKPLWAQKLIQGFSKVLGQDAPNVGEVQTFNPMLKLIFMGGPQIDEEVLLGYGPRMFGSATLDVELKDPVAPFQAFELHSVYGQVVYKTKEPYTVKLNGQELSEGIISEGDIISLGETKIRVTFIKTS